MHRIKVTQRVRIGIELEDGQILQFFSYIKKITRDRLFLVFPESKAAFAQYLKEGTAIRLSIYTAMGILLTSSVVLNEPKNCEFEVEYLKSNKRIQRRKYVRIKANYRMILEQNNKTYTTLSEDISGGGIRFISDEKLQHIETKAKIFIPKIKEGIEVTGKIIQKQNSKPNEYIIVFTDIKETDRNKIIQQCLEEEAKSINLE